MAPGLIPAGSWVVEGGDGRISKVSPWSRKEAGSLRPLTIVSQELDLK